jgi:3-dehydroquinate synthase
MSEHKKLLVELGERSYPIWIGKGLRQRIATYLEDLKIHVKQRLLLITDDQVGPIYAEEIISQLVASGYSVSLFTVPAGESSKSLSQYESIMSYAIEQKLDRQSLILALGGGVVGDLAGFVASTFMRGIPFIQLPTTILAHDSSVGGKVAINHPLGKNLIGSFYQPIAVIYDTETLASLPQREKVSGFAEVLKHGIIWDATFVEWLDEHSTECLALEEPYLSEALYRACQIKTKVVAQDETEQHIRAILNFGHTFGHAFESLGSYSMLTHGEAISVGMVLAARLSEKIHHTQGMEDTVRKLLEKYGLPVSRNKLPWSEAEILKKMYGDKKVIANSLNLVLLRQMGQAELVKNVSPDLVNEVLVKGGDQLVSKS